ncbi:hypothetical protein ACLMJK_005809 [Lecanora helva]
MSSYDQKYKHHAIGLESDTQPSHNPAATSNANSSIPPLPAYTYKPTSIRRPKVPTAFENNHSSVRANGDSRSDSPDPHDFYRRHQEQYRASLEEASSQGDIRVERRDGNMAAAGQRSSPMTTRSHTSRLPPQTSRINTRYTSSPTADRSPLSAAKSSPTLSNTARNRQTSLKDLVDKFNQTTDEALPLPKKPASRSPSTSSNPSATSRNARVNTRIPSLSKDLDDDHGRKNSSTSLRCLGTARSQPREGRTSEDSNQDSRSKRAPRTPRVDRSQFTSQSTTNLGQHGDETSRKPLFGEIVGMSPSHPDPGFGIPKTRRRRGSEGSMHSPNPMFPRERGRQLHELPPSSPSAWYLGATPTLDEIKTEKAIPELPANLHRRTRSEFSGTPAQPSTSDMSAADHSPTRDPQSSSSSTTTSKRSSRSRIPISTVRRQSTTSDSGNSTVSTRASSTLGRAHVNTPARPAAKIPKPIHIYTPRSPPWHSRSSTPQKSPRVSDFTSGMGRPATSPRLAAYISAPLPKKSPPLRSSRPRQPVSNASTSASRARAVEKFSGHDSGSMKTYRDTRHRKPPELAGVDFAARRQRIQQAVTRTVKEEERKEEERRASMALSRAAEQHASKAPITAEDGHISDERNRVSTFDTEPSQEATHQTDEQIQNPEDVSSSERDMTINTGHLAERSVLDLSVEDSPTLGTYHRFQADHNRGHDGGDSTPSDIEPSSAITAATSDSVDTFFDDEPQDEYQDHQYEPSSSSQEQQTLLNQIMDMRDATPSPEIVRRPPTMEESVSEHDDRESIQIMLGESPVLEKSSSNDPFDATHQEPPPRESHESRWSMSSWTSSNRDREAPMERIDEHSPSDSDQPAHLSISTSASQQTPQPWSPQSFASPKTARTTMDSDTYSTINRVLDHYHNNDYVSPELLNDVQQRIVTQSPDLARQGGWDPKRVMALYMQDIAKGKHAQSTSISDQSKLIRPRTSSMKVPAVTEKEVRDDHAEKMVDNVEREDEEPTPPGTNLTVNGGEFNAARASLTDPNDWDMSPSLGGLELQAEAVDSPADDKPRLRSKDWGTSVGRDLAEMPDAREGPSRQTADSRPLLPPIEGLGLELNLTPPQKDDSPMDQPPPPPLPFHSPPPPPMQPSPPIGMRSPPSPSIYSKHVPSAPYPPVRVPTSNGIIPPLPNVPISDATYQSYSATPPSQPSAASSVRPSQDQASAERPSISAEVASKASSPSPDQKRLTKRRHIIKELIDTEHSFCQDMKVVDDIYKATANIIVMTAEDVKVLFGNSDQIIDFSTNFLDALKQSAKSIYILPKSKRWRSNRVSNSTSHSGNTDDQSSVNGVDFNDDEKDRSTSIGEAFAEHMAVMEKVYTDYLKNHDAANQKLQSLQKIHKVDVWLKECQSFATDLTSAWDLDSLLVKPVQRILKYPLLLDQLLEATPENHPDFTALDVAAREVKGMAKRIDETKRRADLMEQVTNTRKRKESDVRIGLSKAFGRRTEKLRQQVGLSDTVEDKAYAAVSERFGSHFFQLQVVMRDVEMYTNDVVDFMNRFCRFAQAMEAHIEVGQTSYPELESKWRKFRMTISEMSTHALPDHVSAVRKNVIEPMTTLLKLHEGPQKLMQKRNKRLMDFARLKAAKDRGEKPDKKTAEQGAQFEAINETLKDELPKLFAMTGRLVEACLNNFVQLQIKWQGVWRKLLTQAIDDKVPTKAQDVVDAFTGNFAFFEAQVLSLGLCNGSMLNEVANQINFLSPSTTLSGGEDPATRQTSHSSSLELSKQRTQSVSSEKSPVIPHPDFGGRSSGSFLPLGDGGQLAPTQTYPTSNRVRASSTLSGHSPRTPEVPGSYHSYSSNTTPIQATPNRPLTATPRTYTEPSPSIPRPSVESSSFTVDPTQISGTTFPSSSGSSQARDTAESQRYSDFFSSAMPMSDSPPTQSPAPGEQGEGKHYRVIFLAASVYEFSIDRARKEAGYPYLTYVAGEIFDVIGEKGELWLAKNQDDRNNLVGWIWNKHFVKLAS